MKKEQRKEFEVITKKMQENIRKEMRESKKEIEESVIKSIKPKITSLQADIKVDLRRII